MRRIQRRENIHVVLMPQYQRERVIVKELKRRMDRDSLGRISDRHFADIRPGI
jgi:hypothetical protein